MNSSNHCETAAPYQLLSMSVFRAVENHVAVVRAGNTGVSGVIDPFWRIRGTVQNGELAVKPDDPLLALLSREKKLVTKYDIAEDPRYALVKDSCGESFARVAGFASSSFLCQ